MTTTKIEFTTNTTDVRIAYKNNRAVAYVQNDRGEMVYTFSRPYISKENEECGYGN